jgi:hypothetical protein
LRGLAAFSQLAPSLLSPALAAAGIFAAAAIFNNRAAAAETLDYAQLVRRIYDLEALASPPAPGERTVLASTRDRGSRYDEKTGRYENWGANDDGPHYIREEDGGQVLAEFDGPGVIWRIWSAKPERGVLRIEIDGKTVFSRPFAELFDNTRAPFAHSTLNRVMARGHNLFVPIPFQKSCKISGRPGWGKYFQATCTLLPAGTVVPSFTGAFDKPARLALALAQDVIAHRGALAVEGETTRREITVAPGETAAVFDLAGPSAIVQLRADSPLFHSPGAARALRELALAITWDGGPAPAVWAPLGDFFGCGFGANHYASLPAGFSRDGFYSRWFMPFSRRALLQIKNDGAQPRTLSLEVTQKPAPDAARLLRFHAKWHRNHFGPAAAAGRYFDDRWPDWPFLLAAGGEGRFCGLALHVWNPLHKPAGKAQPYELQFPALKNPLPEKAPPAARSAPSREALPKWWWGEGDEKFFVDGEPFPSTFGTGTEDYFGYAWADTAAFDSHSQNQPLNNGNTGHIVNSRWHIADNVPFRQSFEGCLEKYHGDNWPLLYAATAFWYQAPGAADSYKPLPLAERCDYFAPPKYNEKWLAADGKDWRAARDALGWQIIEAEDSAPPAGAGGALSRQHMGGYEKKAGAGAWSGSAQLLCKADGPGASFTIEIAAPDGRPAALHLFPTRAPDFAIIKATVNGRPAPAPFDGYAPRVEPAGSFKLGVFAPRDGRFIIKITAAGANPENRTGRYYIGLDAIGIAPE